MEQVGALPYRIGPDGTVEVLLITSRVTRRWIIPKGNPIRGLTAHQAAAREAFEEAGINGKAEKSRSASFITANNARGIRMRTWK